MAFTKIINTVLHRNIQWPLTFSRSKIAEHDQKLSHAHLHNMSPVCTAINVKVPQCIMDTSCQVTPGLHFEYEPRYEFPTINTVVFATSKASDQPAHTRSLIRAVASRLDIL